MSSRAERESISTSVSGSGRFRRGASRPGIPDKRIGEILLQGAQEAREQRQRGLQESLTTAEVDALQPMELQSSHLHELKQWVSTEVGSSPITVDPQVEARSIAQRMARQFVLDQDSSLQRHSRAQELLEAYAYALARMKLFERAQGPCPE